MRKVTCCLFYMENFNWTGRWQFAHVHQPQTTLEHHWAGIGRTVTPDAVGANTVINACARAGRWAQTLAQLEDMAPGC